GAHAARLRGALRALRDRAAGAPDPRPVPLRSGRNDAGGPLMANMVPHGLPFAPVKVDVLIDIDMGTTGMAGICRSGARSDRLARCSGRSWVAHWTTLHALRRALREPADYIAFAVADRTRPELHRAWKMTASRPATGGGARHT